MKTSRHEARWADDFAYNARGEVTNAMISTGVWNYAHDHIGNRTAATDVGATTAYTANEVNQYTAVGTTDPQYDLDGNLVAFGNCTNAWNAAGQLVSTTWTETNGLKRLRNEYDYRGRRVRRVSETSADGGLTWTVAETRDFVYDDWNLLFERSERPSEGAAELAFFWGPDLSDTLQGAGGVGGLVAVSVGGDFYFPGYDNNGNVVGYWDESGGLVAEYSYDAFGNMIASSGTMATVFPHRFSTKYYDAETGLYYYGYRYYSPSLGRWISRDPIEENDSHNLFVIVQNNPLSFFDILGERIGQWPSSSETDGWAFLGNMNFPGPGWSGSFRIRPTTQFDLAAKIHDLHYALNGLSFSAKQNITGRFNPQKAHGSATGKSAELSRKAKSDYIFKMMNKVHWEGGRWSGTLNFLSRQVFYDDPQYFCRGDDFANFLLQPESWQLNDPEFLLMIPYSQLKFKPTKSLTQSISFPIGGSKGGDSSRTLTKEIMVPDYYSETSEDRMPGFIMWAKQNLGETIQRILMITDQTDSSFAW